MKPQEPEIIIYSREGCGICERIKERISKLGFWFQTRDADSHLNYRDDWREAHCEEVLAGYMLNDEHLPVISVDGEFMKINRVLNLLKEMKDGTTQ